MMIRNSGSTSKTDSGVSSAMMVGSDIHNQEYLSRLKFIFKQEEHQRPPTWKYQIQTLNLLKIGPGPALIAYMVCKLSGDIPGEVDQEEIAFWRFLFENGASRRFLTSARHCLMMLVVHKKNIHALRWMIEECLFKIDECPAVNNPIKPGTPSHALGLIDFRAPSAFNDYFFSYLIPLTPLHEPTLILALRYGTLPLVAWLIHEKGCDINAANDQGVTPLIEAVKKSQYGAISYLIRHKASLLAKTNDGLTAVHYAIWNSNVDLVMELTTALAGQGVSMADIRDKEGLTVLHWAIKYNKEPVIKYLESLFHIDETFIDPDGRNLAVFAVEWSRFDISSRLIKQFRLNINATDSNGLNAIFSSIMDAKNGLNKIQWLIDNHDFSLEERNVRGETALLFAASINHQVATAYLLSKMTRDLRDTNTRGEHVGHYLAKHDQHQVILSLLKDNRIDLLHANIEGLTMLDIALLEESKLSIGVCIQYIQSYHSQSNTKPPLSVSKTQCLPHLLHFMSEDTLGLFSPWVEAGQPPLHMACLYLAPDQIERLISTYKLNVNQLNQQNQTALYCMVKQSINRSLMAKKSHWFIAAFSPKITKLDPIQSSLLHLACENQDLELAQFCVEARHLPILKARKDHLNALDIALIKRDIHLVTYLWNRLTSDEQASYIIQLNSKKEQQHISYLSANQLYKPPFDGEAQEEISLTDSPTRIPTPDITLIPNAPLICDRDRLFEAIDERQIDYIKSLKHQPEWNALFSSCAEEAMLLAVEQKQHALVYHLLRIPAILQRAHKNDNAALVKACELGLLSIVECLLRIPAIQHNIGNNNHAAFRRASEHSHQEILTLLLNYPEVQDYADLTEPQKIERVTENETFDAPPMLLNPLASEWIAYPTCCRENATLKSLVNQLSDFVNNSLCQHAYIYGSFHFKKPNDLDILLANITTMEAKSRALDLIHSLVADTGMVTITNRWTGEYGYRKHGLHIIPMDWRGIKLEWVLTEKYYTDHALKLDFTIGAQYFNLRTRHVHDIPGLNSRHDVLNKRINTISEPCDSFREDLSRMFRAIRLMADEMFYLSEACESALIDLFSDGFNPFIKMNPDKLNQQLTLMFKSPDPSSHATILYKLGALKKLFDCLSSNAGQSAGYYTEKLRPFYESYYPAEALLSCSVAPIHLSGNPHAFYLPRKETTDLPFTAPLHQR